MKYLLTFSKGEPVRWLGHLDMLRTFERAIRRANLPIAFTAGFNPRGKMAFASAQGVGVTGDREAATIELTADVTELEVMNSLNDMLPAGIRIVNVEAIPDAGSRDLLNSFTQSEFLISCTMPEEMDLSILQAASSALCQAPSLPVTRVKDGKSRTIDMRPWVADVQAIGISNGRADFRLVLAITGEGSARPAEIVGLLAQYAPGLALRRAHRVRLIQETAHEG